MDVQIIALEIVLIMRKKIKIIVLPGDGIGTEISNQALKIINWANDNFEYEIDVSEDYVGGEAIDKFDSPLTDNTLEKLRKSDAILLGAVGGPKWENLSFEKRPERGLLKIRKELDLFANFRPAIVFDSLIEASSLKPEFVSNLDLLIIRELTGGIYFGEPRGIKDVGNGKKIGINTLVYDTEQVERIANVAFEAAMKRNKKLCSVDKANVLESTELWRDVISFTSNKYPDVEVTNMYVDNAAMQLVRNPKQFDVIVTTNMFGDILSDCASMLTGSLGMLPSASLGFDNTGKRNAMYEPVHGSAPDIAGKNIANPLAMILSVSMMFEYSFANKQISQSINNSINSILKKGYRTKDIMEEKQTQVTTEEMGNLVLEELKNEKI
tara:strand:- start:1797 stop:2942 length:1146 start_codon:yes stop_codon:yes gene_type:complete